MIAHLGGPVFFIWPYAMRAAREGERYETTLFPSGTIRLTAPGAPHTAVCLACDTALRISDIPAALRQEFRLGARETAVFTRLDNGSYQDAVRFANGAEVSLQRFPTGVGFEVKQLLENMKHGEKRIEDAAYAGA